MSVPNTCVVLPVYNEILRIHRTVEQVLEYVSQRPKISFLFVDDGSTDGTAEYLHKVLAHGDYPAVSLLRYERNRGKGYAIKMGFLQNQADYLIFTDGDLGYSLDYFSTMIERLSTHEVVIGSRSSSLRNCLGSNLKRQVLGRGINLLARALSGLPFQDTQAGLKGFQREAARRIFGHKLINGYAFDVEVLFLARKYGCRVAEIPVEVDSQHSYRHSKLNLICDSFWMLSDLLKIRWYDWLGDYEQYKTHVPLAESLAVGPSSFQSNLEVHSLL